MRHSYADNVFLLGLTFLLGWRREDYFNMGKLLAGAEAKTSQKQPKSVICPPVISGTNSLKLPALQLRKIDVLHMTAWSPHVYFLCSAVSPEESIAPGVAVTVLNLKQERSQLCSYRLSCCSQIQHRGSSSSSSNSSSEDSDEDVSNDEADLDNDERRVVVLNRDARKKRRVLYYHHTFEGRYINEAGHFQK